MVYYETKIRKIAYHETKIRQERIVSFRPGHVNHVTFWDLLPEFSIKPIRAREESLYRGQNLPGPVKLMISKDKFEIPCDV